MCKAANEPGGPFRCSADARRRWLRASADVHRLELQHSAIRSALGMTAASYEGDHVRDEGSSSNRSDPGDDAMVNWSRLRRLPLSYPEHGATAGELPAGYHHMRREQPLGVGEELFADAADQVMRWQMQRGAGVTIESSTAVAQPGTAVVVGVGPLKGACRVIYVVDEPHRRGFAYGTLDGHPESGEEYFGVRFDPADNTVYAEIVAFSRPGRWWSKAGSRVASLVQQHITNRYMQSLVPRS